MGQLPAELEEAFFERNFEYGDDTETMIANVEKSLEIIASAYKKADEITTSIEDGECIDESEAILTFQTLALSLSCFTQFNGSFPHDVQDAYMIDLASILM